jgi:hypothetical protein
LAPTTLVGLAFFVASLGPGFVYLRVAERRRPTPERSALAEAVEMVILGAAISLLSALLVLAVAGTDWLAWKALIERPQRQIDDHPFRLLGPLAAALVISYIAAWIARVVVNAPKPKIVPTGLTRWQQAFWRDRPSDQHSAIVTAELRDGRTFTGMVRGFTVQEAENRELLLHAPLAVRRRSDALPEEIQDAFVVIREEEVLYLAGRYWPPPSAAQD